MRNRSPCLAGVVAAAGLLGLPAGAAAESCSLELHKVDTSSSGRGQTIFRTTYPQHFSMPISEGVRFGGQDGMPRFADVIQKEPAAYQARHPVRGVVKLGSQHFGYVLDSSVKATVGEAEEAEPKPSGGWLSSLARMLTGAPESPKKAKKFQVVPYDRLYFDRNHDGDLSDEEVIEAQSTDSYGERDYYSTSFPRIDVPIEIGSAKLDYAFTLRVTAYGSEEFGYVSGSVHAAAYREGEIMLAGKKHRLVLIDFNSNGRFDDAQAIDARARTPDGTVHATQGDQLYVDPDLEADSRNPYDINSADDVYALSKLLHINGRFYELSVSPAGDRLTLEPSEVAVGCLASSNPTFSALVYGKQGIVKIRGDESGKAAVPVGSWKLHSYTLDRTGFEEPRTTDPKAGPSVMDVLAKALGPTVAARAPRSTFVSATATTKYEAVEVVAGETAELTFGPPYRPVVDVQYREGANQVSLGLSLIGSAGEICTDMQINGNQPAKPKFTITTGDGKTVAEGNFEYG